MLTRERKRNTGTHRIKIYTIESQRDTCMHKLDGIDRGREEEAKTIQHTHTHTDQKLENFERKKRKIYIYSNQYIYYTSL